MARPGIHKQDVFSAAAHLQGQGIRPTIEQIRRHLQTGSHSTIATHLREWHLDTEKKKNFAFHSQLPEEMIANLQGVWEKLNQLAEARCTELENEHQSTIQKLEQELEKYKANNQRWQKLYEQWILEKNKNLEEKTLLKNQLIDLQKEQENLRLQEALHLQKLEEKQERLHELNRLCQRTQENLEHYREAARQERLLEQERYETEKQELQLENKNLREAAFLQRELANELKQEISLYQQTAKNIEITYHECLEKQVRLEARLEETEIRQTELTQLNLKMQQKNEALQEALLSKTQEWADLRTENKILEQENQERKEGMQILHDQHKALLQDKWLLSEEKARLEGQLKQAMTGSASKQKG